MNPPRNYEDIIKEIHESYDGLSRTNQRIARYVSQNPNDVAILSSDAIAKKSEVHASSLVRFAQIYGYKGFKELQAIFKARLATAAPGFEARVRSLKDELNLHAQHGMKGFLGDLVARDIASIQDLLSRTKEKDFQRAVDLLEKAETIYIVGQLRSEPIAIFIRYVLTMLKRRTSFLDESGGLATHIASVMRPTDVLIAVSFRYYATEVVNIAEAAHANGFPIIAISDSTLSPLAKTAAVLFTIPEDEYSFSRSLAAPMCLAQALMVALAARLQRDEQTSPRIPVATQDARR